MINRWATVFLLSLTVSYDVQSCTLNVDFYYLWIMYILELIAVFTLFLIFVVNDRFVVPVHPGSYL